jgi:hypothetical protein
MIKPIMPVEYGKCMPTVKLVAIVHAHSETSRSRVIRVHLIVLTKAKKDLQVNRPHIKPKPI